MRNETKNTKNEKTPKSPPSQEQVTPTPPALRDLTDTELEQAIGGGGTVTKILRPQVHVF